MRIERGPDPGPVSAPRDYLAQLRELFNCRCAYCRVPDRFLGGEEAVEVDHFRPKNRFRELRLTWTNLYYSCRVCNGRKWNHPGTKDEAEGRRFVDPCADDPDDHFRMIRDRKHRDFCRIRPLSEAGEYTVRRLQFNSRKFLRDHWREIDAEEKKLARQLDDLSRVLHVLNVSNEEYDRIQSMTDDVETQLAGVRDRRPFPIDSSK